MYCGHMKFIEPIDKPEKQAETTPSVRTRSPGYPAFGLKSSLERARAVYEHEKRNAASVTALAADWGLNVKSSTTLLTVSSLKKFGLLEEVDGGKERGLKLSQVALNIILNEQEDSPERIGLLKQCALTPKIHADLWNQYGGELPSDANLKRHLIMEKDFNDASVDGFIKQFKDTISFAKLSPSDKITLNETEDSETKKAMKSGQSLMQRSQELPASSPSIGDFVAKTYANIGAMSVLREFTVPLSGGSVSLKVPYPMQEDDFQLFIDTLNLWKKRLVRVLAPIPPAVKLPANATWKNNDTDKPVKIVAVMGERDGEQYYQSEDGTGIPASQLTFGGIKLPVRKSAD